uniref:Uncharacterized protein n=1 Tax=Knipowitschia caucasica TaxID=637954 RepID=A0AAV2JEM0_KNICA
MCTAQISRPAAASTGRQPTRATAPSHSGRSGGGEGERGHRGADLDVVVLRSAEAIARMPALAKVESSPQSKYGWCRVVD